MTHHEALNSEALAQILLIESMVSHLPDEAAIFAFVCRGLERVPGVQGVCYEPNNDESQDGTHTKAIPLKIDSSQYGALVFQASDSAEFSCYLPYLANLCHMLAVVLDQRHQRDAVLEAKKLLEHRIEQRTQQLTSEIHERKQAEKLARSQQLRAERYLDVSQAIIVELDQQGHVSVINPRGCDTLGYHEKDIIGREWFSLALPKTVRAEVREVFTKIIAGDIAPVDYYENEIITCDNDIRSIAWRNVQVFDDQGRCTGTLSSGQDITARKNAERQAHKLAFYDVLTDLPNRRLMIDRLHQSMAYSARNNHWKALLFLDLDDFKDLNDSLGHDQGDQMLIESAQRIKDCVRDIDTVSRHGGDEFVVLLELLDSNAAEAVNNAGAVVEKITRQLALPYRLNDHHYQSTVSIGIALFQGLDTDIKELLKRADMAMYQAKAAGKNNYRFFDPQMQQNIDRRRSLEADLADAIANQEFQLYYQPQVGHNGQCLGAEALIRWVSPTRGFVSPIDFIPLAEDTRLIIPIGQWVLKQACQQLRLWDQSELTRKLTLAVNVSAVQFHQPSFTEQVLETVTRSGIDPTRLKLEITESMLMQDVDAVIDKMDRLKHIGITFSLDDFGTGYSSLSYVKRLPIDQLKIDRSFVRDILTDPSDAAICRAITAMGKSLDLETIAEGVEEIEQWQALNSEGCHSGQGFLFARPMTADDFSVWVEGQHNIRSTIALQKTSTNLP